ncbi:MAG: inner membrane protein [Pseudomonadota bacterium]|jgi:membrane protein implicated in regulation of membrane protease activity|nr:inner membrane protein [Pseudomonadota bacterium]MDQ1311323.1 inner membrane protein [Pseudomonadota bacterium]MDQ1341524.1 inner membrane protein [Pseudomonadota bacterium]MDQ1345280.1 inner membrane protein [Pseudomonadota bacterium]
MSWFVIFACSVFGLYFWRERRVQQQDMQSSTSPLRTGERYIGQVLTLSEGLRDGAGQVKLGNRRWTLRGPNAPAGSRVRVTGVDGAVLIVDRLPG